VQDGRGDEYYIILYIRTLYKRYKYSSISNYIATIYTFYGYIFRLHMCHTYEYVSIAPLPINTMYMCSIYVQLIEVCLYNMYVDCRGVGVFTNVKPRLSNICRPGRDKTVCIQDIHTKKVRILHISSKLVI
jgi:hypothetical protein